MTDKLGCPLCNKILIPFPEIIDPQLYWHCPDCYRIYKTEKLENGYYDDLSYGYDTLYRKIREKIKG